MPNPLGALLPWGVVRSLIVVAALTLPLGLVVRTNRKLTWASAVVLGAWLMAISLILIADIPSRILYWFDQTHAPLALKFHFLQWWEKPFGGNTGYQLIADVVANTVQGLFFVIIAAGAYFWGEKHRKEGKFKS